MLGIRAWGQTPNGRPLGSILPHDAAAAGRNFTSIPSEQTFLERRRRGWGVDPVRMTSYMTSSQALLVNLLGPLLERPTWLLSVLGRLLARDAFHSLDFWEVEFAPPMRSHYLGDMTRVDAFFMVRGTSGPEAIVLELKYTDRFSSRAIEISNNVLYRELARSTGLWSDPINAFADKASGQLLRCHALGARVSQRDYGGARTSMLLVSHPTDQKAATVFRGYQRHLSVTEDCSHVTLTDLLEASSGAAQTSAESAIIGELRRRYLMHELSEDAWSEHLDSARKANARD